jgi:NTP pyrophosphatase (non-canonical NTP hydrolase)
MNLLFQNLRAFFRARRRVEELEGEVERLQEGRRVLILRLAWHEEEARRVAAGEGPPELTRAEIERLAWLAEELGEAAQAVGKVLRFGWKSNWKGGHSNRVALETELGDVTAALDLMIDARDVRGGDVRAWRNKKRARVARFLFHQGFAAPAPALKKVEGEQCQKESTS